MKNLESLFSDLNQKYFDGALKPIDLHWNSRLRSSAGRFVVKKERSSFFMRTALHTQTRVSIELASYLLKVENADFHLRDTLAHEMVHYWLWSQKKPYGHTPEFNRKLTEIGASRYNPLAPVRPAKYLLACPSCQKTFKAQRWSRKPTACLECCKKFNQGKYDSRFRIQLVKNL